jgi:hypothetical protein
MGGRRRVARFGPFKGWYVQIWEHAGEKAVPQLRWLFAGFQLWWPGFDPRSGHVGFVVNKVTLGQVSYKYLGFPLHNYHSDCSTLVIYHLRLVHWAKWWPTYQVDSVSPHPKTLTVINGEENQGEWKRSDVHELQACSWGLEEQRQWRNAREEM